jgi:hypothetical protein
MENSLRSILKKHYVSTQRKQDSGDINGCDIVTSFNNFVIIFHKLQSESIFNTFTS